MDVTGSEVPGYLGNIFRAKRESLFSQITKLIVSH